MLSCSYKQQPKGIGGEKVMDEYVDGKNDIPADENTIEPHEAAQYVMEDGEETREKKGEWLSKMMPFKLLHVVQSVQVCGGGLDTGEYSSFSKI